jgi:hypothetical protein
MSLWHVLLLPTPNGSAFRPHKCGYYPPLPNAGAALGPPPYSVRRPTQSECSAPHVQHRSTVIGFYSAHNHQL